MSDPTSNAAVDEAMTRFMSDFGAAGSIIIIQLGWRIGLWDLLADGRWRTAEEIAGALGTNPLHTRELLRAAAAGAWAGYDPATTAFGIDPGTAAVLAGPLRVGVEGFVTMANAMADDLPALGDALAAGDGFAWERHSEAHFVGQGMASAVLVAPAVPVALGIIPQVHAVLTAGGSVADIGAGSGAPTLAIAQAYPAATVTGFDIHEPCLEFARKSAADAGVAERVTFETANAKGYPGSYDVITFVDVLHDLGDPVGALVHARSALRPGGAVVLVEPNGSDRVEENLNPMGRIWYQASVLFCTANAVAEEGHALGTLAGETRLREVAAEAGFRTVTRAEMEDPFNLVLVLQP